MRISMTDELYMANQGELDGGGGYCRACQCVYVPRSGTTTGGAYGVLEVSQTGWKM